MLLALVSEVEDREKEALETIQAIKEGAWRNDQEIQPLCVKERTLGWTGQTPVSRRFSSTW